ncbi:hypothetical protein ACT7DH_05370 [Bacillus pacificus]
MLWFGIGEQSKIFLITLIQLSRDRINTVTELMQAVEEDKIRSARSMVTSEWQNYVPMSSLLLLLPIYILEQSLRWDPHLWLLLELK